jgi:N-acylneuraminate cytidylyltransferase
LALTIAIIPARGGSKRIPRKNLKAFGGRPIMAWSIEAALATGLFDHVLVSSDDEEIRELAKSEGAEAPFLRPPEISDDHTPTMPVLRHAIEWTEASRGEVATACCIYATAPFITTEDLKRGHAGLESHADADFAFSVTTFAFPIQRALKVTPQGRVEMFWPENEMVRSQDLEEAYHDAGQFYWGRRDAFFRHDGFFRAASVPVVLPRHAVQDIDTPEDWDRAERMFRSYH